VTSEEQAHRRVQRRNTFRFNVTFPVPYSASPVLAGQTITNSYPNQTAMDLAAEGFRQHGCTVTSCP
jgi:hypothetical protein